MTASRRLAPLPLLLIGLAVLGVLLLTPETRAQSRDSGSDFALHPENADPKSIWSDGETLWVGDDRARKVFAYKLWDDPGTAVSEYGTRDPGRDVPSLGQEDFHVTGHGPRLYVAEEALDGASRDVFGYDLTSLTRLEDRDFVYGGPNVAGGVLIVRGTATDGRHLWITDTTSHAHAFRLFDDPETPEDEYGRPDTSRRLTIPGRGQLRGLFTDGRTMWGVRLASHDASVRSVNLSDGTEAGYDFPLHEDNDHAYGIWSDGETFYVVDADDAMIYTYHGVGGVVGPAGEDAETAAALVGNTTQPGDAGHDLGSTGAKRAQAFTTGNNNAGYALASIGIEFDDVSDPSSAPTDLEATLNADGGGVPGDALCTLIAPASLSERSVNTFAAPGSGTTCPTLVQETTYFVVVERVRATGSSTIAVGGTASGSEDTGAAVGWSIADGGATYSPQAAAQGWAPDAFSYKTEVRGSFINNSAAGEATVTGTPQVGETLTADSSAITDEDGLDDVTYRHQWLAGGSDIDGATGSSYELTSSEQGQTVQVRVTFTDDADNAESLTSAATVAVAAKTNSPATGAPTTSGTPQVGEILTADTSAITDEDGLDDVTYRHQWLAGGSDIDGATNSIYTLTSSEQGQTVQVRVTFTDDADNAESLTSAATVGVAAKTNSPATGAPTISGTPQVGEILTADTSAITDEDGLDDVTYRHQWMAGGSDIDGATGSSYELTSSEQGQTVQVRVTFADDADNAESLTSAATKTVAAAPNPEATGLPTISGTPQVGETLTADTSGIDDADGLENVTYRYQWLAGGSDIAGATGSSYELTNSEQGQTVQVRVTFADDAENAESLTSVATETVAAAPNPEATGLPTISGTPQVGETLTADTSGIDDADGLENVTYRYQWMAGGSDIDGATGSSYELTSSEQGQTITVRVSFTDAAENAESLTSTATVAVAAKTNSPATGAPTISGTPQVGETLTADTSAIADEDGLDDVTYRYQWMTGGSDIDGATGSSYELTSSEQGQTITVRVTFTDDAENAESLTSVATEAVAAAPNLEATGLPTISGTPQVGEILTADTSAIADEDGLDDVTYRHQWLAGGSDIEGATGSSYELTSSEQGQTIQVRVTFSDDVGNEETLISEATEAEAAAPVPLTVSVTVSAPATHDGSSAFTFDIEFSEELGLSYTTLKSHAFNVTGGTVERAQRTDKPSNISWRITVRPTSTGDVVIELPVTTDCNAEGAICTGDGRKLSNSLNLTVSGPGG